ncbi:polyhydroxyalkanoic acid system family protein [Deminuibacter soli]|uniref:Polyhydroxyalkanoic acid system protein n=1 Tax=Deminuibacter soli TaxID=2291815 RepID=A0A3E1NKQ5_9BACT|nr:polyhydroxyalkanoic acid system family protein [Deminuibacter soli]RFM28513.1 hypothetical protein DXN05_06815 [Deminuibacter soli]
MSDLNISVPHSLPKEEALTRIKNMIQQLQREQAGTISNVQENWEGNTGNFSFSAKGFDLAGTILVNDSNVEINSKLPFAVSLFKGAISSMIQQKASALLA